MEKSKMIKGKRQKGKVDEGQNGKSQAKSRNKSNRSGKK